MPKAGSIGRKMREAIFTHPEKKSQLESILHPLIAEKVD